MTETRPHDPDTERWHQGGEDELTPEEEAALEWSDIDAEAPEFRAEVLEDLTGGLDDDLDQQAAERLIRRLWYLDQEADEAAQFIDEEITQARFRLEALIARRAEIMKPIERKQAYLRTFYPALEAWAKRALTYSKSRSIKLAYGTVKFVKGRESLRVDNEAAAVQWALENGHSDAVKYSLNKKPVTEYIRATGDVPPGVELVRGDDTFTVETEG